MFALTLAGLVPAALLYWLGAGLPKRGAISALMFCGAVLLGVLPRPLGALIDPYDAYPGQLTLSADRPLLENHARLLVGACLPRLIAGHRFPGYLTDPDPEAPAAGPTPHRKSMSDALGPALTVLSLALAAAAFLALGVASFTAGSATGRAVARGLFVSTCATLAAFVAYHEVFNSDNYRYIVGLLVPWPVGFGLAMRGVSRRGRDGRLVATGLALALAVMMTADLARWYARFGWVDGRYLPVRTAPEDSALAWLEAHPDYRWVEGGYWDVYRLAFLTGGRVRGAPFPVYPNRYAGWRPRRGEPKIALVRPTPDGRYFADATRRQGGKIIHHGRGFAVIAWPQKEAPRE
jgi:hypothetical protein